MELIPFNEEEISELYSEISSGWNDCLAHVSRVYSLCEGFLKKIPETNEKILLTSALLHDIGHKKEGSHAMNGSLMAREELKNKDFTESEIETISECIKTHSLKGEEEPLSIEGKILSDCDRLDVIGIDTWLGVLDSKIEEGISMDQAIKECSVWEEEWLSLGTRFFTKEGRDKYEKIKEEKRKIIEKIKEKGTNRIRRGILIYCFDKNLRNILLVKRTEEDIWGVIAGTSEKNEDFIRTATRELEEETNLKRNLFDLYPSNLYVTFNEKEKSLDVLYEYGTREYDKDEIRIRLPEEICEISWYSINDLPKNMIQSRIELNLDNFQKNEKIRSQ